MGLTAQAATGPGQCAKPRWINGRTTVETEPEMPSLNASQRVFYLFEMSAGAHRLIVNCGAGQGDDERWALALRATAAHSTLILGDASSGVILPPGAIRRALGARLIAGPNGVKTRRSDNAQGTVIEARHEFYLPRFGVVHRRRLHLSPKGLVLTGSDHLTSLRQRKGRRSALRFAVRFHIHPDVRVSLAQGGGSVILKLPSGEGWRFRCGGGALSIEESVYLGGGTLRRCEQLVIGGDLRGEEADCAWMLEQIGAV